MYKIFTVLFFFCFYLNVSAVSVFEVSKELADELNKIYYQCGIDKWGSHSGWPIEAGQKVDYSADSTEKLNLQVNLDLKFLKLGAKDKKGKDTLIYSIKNVKIDFYADNLVGEFPNINIKELSFLNINDSPKLTGTFPDLNAPNLEYFSINECGIIGKIPVPIAPKLKYYTVALCPNIEGDLPVMNYPELREFMLSIIGLNTLSQMPVLNFPKLASIIISGNEYNGPKYSGSFYCNQFDSLRFCMISGTNISIIDNPIDNLVRNKNYPTKNYSGYKIDTYFSVASNRLSFSSLCPIKDSFQKSGATFTCSYADNKPFLYKKYLGNGKVKIWTKDNSTDIVYKWKGTGIYPNENTVVIDSVFLEENDSKIYCNMTSNSCDMSINTSTIKLEVEDEPKQLVININPKDKVVMADDSSVVYSIVVSDKEGELIQNAKVEIIDNINQKKINLTTDSNGYCEFLLEVINDVDIDEYSIFIQASHPEYLSSNQENRTVAITKKCWNYPNKNNPTLRFCVEDGVWKAETKGIIKIENKVLVINDLLKFQGTMSINIEEFSLDLTGRFYIDDIKIPKTNIKGEITFWDGHISHAFLSDKIINFNYISEEEAEKFKKGNYFAGLKIIPSRFELFLDSNLNQGMLLAGEIWIENTKNCIDKRKRTKFVIDSILITENIISNEREIAFSSGINGLGFGFGNFDSMTDICLNSLLVSYNSNIDALDINGKIGLNFLTNTSNIEFGIGFIDGSFNKGKINYSTDKPLPLGSLPIGISGLGGELSGISNPPLEIGLNFALRPVVKPRLFEFEIEAGFLYNENNVFDNKMNIKGKLSLWNLKRQNIDEWLGDGSLQGTYYWNKEQFNIESELNIARIKEDNGQYGDKYLFSGLAEIILFNVNNDIDLSFNSQMNVYIPKLQNEQSKWNMINKLKNWYNINIGGKTINGISMNYANNIICGEVDFSQISKIIGKVYLKYFTEKDYFVFEREISEIDLIQEKSKIPKKTIFTTLTNDTIYIPENLDRLVIEIQSNTTIPITQLINSSDEIIEKANDNDVFYQVSDDNKLAWWTLLNPKSGRLLITSNDKKVDDTIRVFALQNKNEKFEYQLSQEQNQVSVNWNTHLGNGQYIEFFLDDNINQKAGIYLGAINKGNSFSYIVPDTLSKCEYYIHLRRMDSDSSIIESIKLGMVTNHNPLLKVPDNIHAYYFTTDSTLRVIWNKVENTNISGFAFMIDNTNNTDSIIALVGIDDTKLELVGSFYENKILKVSTFDINGNSSCSKNIQITTEVVEEVKYIENTNHIIYPNPASDYIIIPEFNKCNEICICNSLGQKIKTIKINEVNNNYKVNIADLIPGTYFVILKSNKEHIYYNFIKN